MRCYRVGGLAVALLMVGALVTDALAKPPTVLSPVSKGVRGAINFVASPLEIPISVSKMTTTYGPEWGVTVGPANGVLAMIERGVAGLVNVLTFYVPVWDQPVLKHRFGETDLTNPYEPAVKVGY